jgi:protein-disulfide isomerase
MKKILSLASLAIASIMISSCSTEKGFESKLKKTLEDNPELVFEIIKNNPDKFMASFQLAAQGSKKNFAKNRAAKEEQALAQALKNPLTPYISKDQIIRGVPKGPITIVEYSDFECPYCSQGRNTVEEIMKKYPGKVSFIFKHLPLSFHPSAMISAKYYEAISLQSPKKAFLFHDEIFTNQSELKQGEAYLTRLSKKLGLDMKKLSQDLHSVKVKAKIDEDMAEARKFNFQGTPGFLINGVPVRGAYPATYFEHIISKLQENGKLVL